MIVFYILFKELKKIIKIIEDKILVIWSYLFIYPITHIHCFLHGIYDKSNLRPRLVWGITPILNFKYLSESMKLKGYYSRTFMTNYYSINKKSDFDIYPDDIINLKSISYLTKISFLDKWLKLYQQYYCFKYCIKTFDIFHMPFDGFFLSKTPLKKYESKFFKLAKKKVIILGYGSDYYRYSLVNDVSIRHVLLMSYPNGGRYENEIKNKFNYWTSKADVIVGGIPVADGWSRWDLLPCNFIVIDTNDWKAIENYSDSDGIHGVVRITHTPNHRGFKGTEFLLKAVNELINEGYKIKLNLIEKQPNDAVKRILSEETDILVEQLIFVGYALSALEGMATGLPVISNLSNEYYTQVLRRFSFLNECPIVSACPETIKSVLKKLITNPSLRKELGILSRKYVEKYHSYKFSQFMFEKIYDKIWFNKIEDTDLFNLYNPNNKKSYNNISEIIATPLINNKLP